MDTGSQLLTMKKASAEISSAAATALPKPPLIKKNFLAQGLLKNRLRMDPHRTLLGMVQHPRRFHRLLQSLMISYSRKVLGKLQTMGFTPQQ